MKITDLPQKIAAQISAGGIGAAILFSAQVRAQTRLEVAADGSAKFKSVQEAIMSVPAGSPTNPVVIHIKPGVYKELIFHPTREKIFQSAGR